MAKQPPHITAVSAAGLKLIADFEGFESKPYLCPAGIYTIGYGSTFYENGKRVTKQDPPITRERAESLLRSVVAGFEKGTDALCTDLLSQQQFDALVSFAYNVGLKALQSSTLLKLVNANRNDPAIRVEFMKWVNGGGRKLPGLVRRRQAEADLYFS